MPVNNAAPVIIKKVKKVQGGGHHGGAWKVAYADFVTAMMAFFLLMWLLNATSEEQRVGIAAFFDPRIPISRTSQGGESMFNGDSPTSQNDKQSDGTGAARSTGSAPDTESTALEDDLAESGVGGISNDTSKRGLTALDDVMGLGADEGAAAAGALSGADASGAQDGAMSGADRGAARDWGDGQEYGAQKGQGERAGGADSRQTVGRDGADGRDADQGAGGPDAAPSGVGDDAEALAGLEDALKEAATAAGGGEISEHINLKISPDGLIIELVEKAGKPLFRSGAADASSTLETLLEVISPIVGSLENELAIVGHTDSTPFAPGARYDNWSLSMDRADAARRALVRLGLPAERIARVTGRADRDPIADDPRAPENRRIAITLLRPRT